MSPVRNSRRPKYIMQNKKLKMIKYYQVNAQKLKSASYF